MESSVDSRIQVIRYNADTKFVIFVVKGVPKETQLLSPSTLNVLQLIDLANDQQVQENNLEAIAKHLAPQGRAFLHSCHVKWPEKDVAPYIDATMGELTVALKRMGDQDKTTGTKRKASPTENKTKQPPAKRQRTKSPSRSRSRSTSRSRSKTPPPPRKSRSRSRSRSPPPRKSKSRSRSASRSRSRSRSRSPPSKKSKSGSDTDESSSQESLIPTKKKTKADKTKWVAKKKKYDEAAHDSDQENDAPAKASDTDSSSSESSNQDTAESDSDSSTKRPKKKSGKTAKKKKPSRSRPLAGTKIKSRSLPLDMLCMKCVTLSSKAVAAIKSKKERDAVPIGSVLCPDCAVRESTCRALGCPSKGPFAGAFDGYGSDIASQYKVCAAHVDHYRHNIRGCKSLVLITDKGRFCIDCGEIPP